MKNLSSVLLFQIERTNKIARLHSQRAFDQNNVGLTIEQWIILKIIDEQKSLSQRELASLSLRDPGSITRTLDILEKKGYVKREAVPKNRRKYNIILTAAGSVFVKQQMPLIESLRNQSIRGLNSTEVKTLQQLLLKVQNNLE